MITMEVHPRQVFERALADIREELEIAKWTRDKKRCKELKRLAKEVQKDLRRVK